jgi:hypothetical protein
MSMDKHIVMVRGSFNATDALCVVASLTGEADARVEKEVIYPYYCFDAGCAAPAAAGRREVSIICLVDAVNGLGATADSFELEKALVKDSKIMELTIDEEHARRIAGRTVTHRLGRAFRTIADFEVKLRHRGLVHKRFWVVRSSEARLLVDSTTAGWLPLKLKAA